MRTPRVTLPAVPRPGETLSLPEREGRHLVVVLRRGAGDPVTLHAADGSTWNAVIRRVERCADTLSVVVEVGAARGESGPAAAATAWRLGVAPVRSKELDAAVRLASELGVAELLPVITARTAARAREGEGRAARWERIALESAKQCGRSPPLAVAAPRVLEDLLAEEAASAPPGAPPGWIAVPARSGADAAPWTGGASFPGSSPGAAPGRRPLFLVGPEGGFTPAEVERAVASGFRPLVLPVPVLRTQTAVCLLAALSVATALLAGAPAPDGGEARDSR